MLSIISINRLLRLCVVMRDKVGSVSSSDSNLTVSVNIYIVDVLRILRVFYFGDLRIKKMEVKAKSEHLIALKGNIHIQAITICTLNTFNYLHRI